MNAYLYVWRSVSAFVSATFAAVLIAAPASAFDLDLSGLQIGKGLAAAQIKASSAAAHLSAVKTKSTDTPEYSAAVRSYLNKLAPEKIIGSAKAQADLDAHLSSFYSHSGIIGGGGLPSDTPLKVLASAPAPDIKPTAVDGDPSYRANQKILLQNSKDRVWYGLPTFGYANTVVVVGGTALCSGTVIGRNVVLTAQHCWCDGVYDKVYVGNIYNDQQPGYKVVRAQSRPMKPCGSVVTAAADVAILVVDHNFDDAVVPATFASSKMIDNATSVRAVGFGVTERDEIGKKMMVDIPIASTNCNGNVGDGNNRSKSAYYGCNAGFELVAGRPLLNKDTCHGDSGGPIFVRDDQGHDYLAGATSRPVTTPNARDCGDGGIYVRADGDVLQWLQSSGVQVSLAN